uniref:TIL domain-containing protein n=1 Tax=Amblyomma maculatum TaxID=34609 RepID=G3MPU6_AMBMU
MSTLQLLLVFGLVMFAAAYWSSDYNEHAHCLDNCRPDNCPSGCRSGCSCYRRFDYPDHGYCMDPSRTIPDIFRNLGKYSG